MSYYDSELFDKAKEWKIPLEPPRTIGEKFTIYKATPTLIIVSTVFGMVSVFIGLLFYFLGFYSDYFVDDWTPASAKCVSWVDSTGERINNTYIPGIRVEYTTMSSETHQTVVKVTEIAEISKYKTLCNNKSTITIDYSRTKPKVAKIHGMTVSAIPAFLAFSPMMFLGASILMLLISIIKLRKVRNVFENGQLTVGKIVDISMMSNQRNRKSSNNTVRITFDFNVDNELFVRKAFVSSKKAQEFQVDQEIPVIYLQMNLKMIAYSPSFYRVEFE